MSQVVVNYGKGGGSLNGRLGSTTSPDSNDPTFIPHAGDNGGNYIYFGGNQNNFMYANYEAAFQITGDIDIRVWVAPVSWATNQGLMSRFDNNVLADRAFEFSIITGNRLQFLYRTSASTANVTRVSVAHTIPDGEAKWVRFTFDVDNGNAQNVAKFFLSDDGETWTQLGTDIVNAGVTDINDGGTTELLVLGRRSSGSNIFMTGKYYRAQLFNGIDGTKVLDVDTSVVTNSNPSQTTLTALTGQTITIGASTSGKKTVIVTSPLWLFGTDDYIEVPNSPLLNFTNSDSFSLVVIKRQRSNYGTNDALIAKKANTTNTTQGYFLGSSSSVGAQLQSQIGDGTNGVTAIRAVSQSSGLWVLAASVRNVAADTLTTYLQELGTSATDTTTGTLYNTDALRIGRLSGAGTEYIDMELFAVLVFRKALTSDEISKIFSYYEARLG